MQIYNSNTPQPEVFIADVLLGVVPFLEQAFLSRL